MNTVFRNIRAELGRNQISIEDLCSSIGIPRGRYYRWERAGDMPVSYLVKVAEVFDGLSVDYLLGLSEKRGGSDGVEKTNSNVG